MAVFFIHFALILAGAIGELTWLIGNGYTVLPPFAENFGKKGEWLTETALGRSLPVSNPVRQSLTAYIQAAGIDGGYAFFAPNVPNSYKTVFEIHYPNGEVEYDLPHISRTASAVRLSVLLDYIGRAKHDALREVLLKMLTYPIWRAHPSAIRIRTIFGYIDEPTATEASLGQKESYEVMYAYDFTLTPVPAQIQPP